jgi:hypothetical protein
MSESWRGLDPFKLRQAADLDRPQIVVEDVEVQYAIRQWAADVWVRCYEQDGTLVADEVVSGQVVRLPNGLSALDVFQSTMPLTAALARATDLSWMWMEVSARRPKPFVWEWLTRAPSGPSAESQQTGRYIMIGAAVLLVFMLLSAIV